jgi:hypothetical protein
MKNLALAALASVLTLAAAPARAGGWVDLGDFTTVKTPRGAVLVNTNNVVNWNNGVVSVKSWTRVPSTFGLIGDVFINCQSWTWGWAPRSATQLVNGPETIEPGSAYDGLANYVCR